MSRTTLRHVDHRPVVAVPSLVATLLLAVVAVIAAPAAPAGAAAYRYWGYYQLQGQTWAFASKGPDQVTPADGAVEGWRFAVADETDTRMPRATATFDELCGDAPAETGKKRVGIVIDYGRAADSESGAQPPAPVGKCAVVDTEATGAEVLAAVATVRAEGGLVCAIDNHPATGCGGEVKEVSPQAKAPDTRVQLAETTASAKASATTDATSAEPSTGSADEGGTSALTYAGLALLLAAIALAIGAAARRRHGH